MQALLRTALLRLAGLLPSLLPASLPCSGRLGSSRRNTEWPWEHPPTPTSCIPLVQWSSLPHPSPLPGKCFLSLLREAWPWGLARNWGFCPVRPQPTNTHFICFVLWTPSSWIGFFSFFSPSFSLPHLPAYKAKLSGKGQTTAGFSRQNQGGWFQLIKYFRPRWR